MRKLGIEDNSVREILDDSGNSFQMISEFPLGREI